MISTTLKSTPTAHLCKVLAATGKNKAKDLLPVPYARSSSTASASASSSPACTWARARS